MVNRKFIIVAIAFLISIFILIIGQNELKRAINEFHYLILSSTSNDRGYIVEVDRIDAPNGTFFDCKIQYVVKDVKYFLHGSISYDVHPNVRVRDVVEVRYNRRNPAISTIDVPMQLVGNFLIWIAIIAGGMTLLVILIRKVIFFLFLHESAS
jgi:hypothetical protein